MKLKIGSRGSALAKTQAEWVAAALKKNNPNLEISFHHITTTGDKDQKATFVTGHKGVFVKEIENALLAKEIDLAVHSLKDVQHPLAEGLMLGPTPQREDARDALISRFGEQLSELPKQSTIGTSSPRRKAQIAYQYKKRKYRIETLRGNVDTRVKKLQEGQYDAIVLAYAGLKRLGLEGEVSQILEPDEILPAACQGCLGLELREDDKAVLEVIQSIKNPFADASARAERAFLQGLGGGCTVPVGVYTQLDKDILKMKTILLDGEGTKAVQAEHSGPASEPDYVGYQLAEKLLYEGGSEILSLGASGTVA